MDAVDAIGMALTPGTVFNQQNKVFRSAKALAQFANVAQTEVLGLIAEHLADRVTIRPSQKRPENGPLIALTEYIPDAAEPALVQIMGGNAVMGMDEAAAPVIGQEGLMDGAQALLEKVQKITGAMDEDDDVDPEMADEAVEFEDVVGINDPDDEEVA